MSRKLKVPQVVDSDDDSGLVLDASVFVRYPYHRVSVKVDVGGEDLTEKSHKDACCINRIMRAVDRHGVLPPDPRGRVPNYGDVSHLNQPLGNLIDVQQDTFDRLVRFTDRQKEEIRLKNIAKRKKDREDAAAYRAHLAAVDKTNTTAGDAKGNSTVGASQSSG